jgi:integrase
MVRQRGQSWQATIIHCGKRFRRSFKTQQEAIRWEAEARVGLLDGREPERGALARNPDDRPRTLGELRDYVAKRFWQGTRAERTVLGNSDQVIEVLGDIEIRSLDEALIDRLVFASESRGNSNGTINRKLACLSKMLSVAHSRGWIERKPRIEKRREPLGRIRWLTRDEERKLVEATRHFGRGRYADLWVFLADTGLRVGEALRLRWADIDLDRKVLSVWVTKGDKPRTLPLTDRVTALLDSLRSEAREGPWAGLNQRTLATVWNTAKASMGLYNDGQFVPHCLRHTFASRLVQAGVPILTVKELCGHKSLSMTMRYSHLAPENLSGAIQVLNGLNPR